MDTKAPSDRSMTLMHYLAKVLRDNYPDLVNFVHELTYLEKAAPGIGTVASNHGYVYTRPSLV